MQQRLAVYINAAAPASIGSSDASRSSSDRPPAPAHDEDVAAAVLGSVMYEDAAAASVAVRMGAPFGPLYRRPQAARTGAGLAGHAEVLSTGFPRELGPRGLDRAYASPACIVWPDEGRCRCGHGAADRNGSALAFRPLGAPPAPAAEARPLRGGLQPVDPAAALHCGRCVPFLVLPEGVRIRYAGE